ncbi:hypothetical protein JCM15765_25630 [Paradesulfitobacterium aromaticivorans]
MDKTYKVYWSQTGLNELANMLAYPPEVKERIFNDSFTRLSHSPTLTAKQIPYGKLEGYWARLGRYQVILLFDVDELNAIVWIDGIKHKRQNIYWKKT